MPSSTSPADLPAVYAALKAVLEPYASASLSAHETATTYELIGPPTPASQKKDVWFGAVRLGKRYTSYHLMPVYAYPDLLDGLSPALKKRMQGKSCFNFTRAEAALLAELAELTRRGHERFRQANLLS